MNNKESLDTTIDKWGGVAFLVLLVSCLLTVASMAIFAILGINIAETVVPFFAKTLCVGFVVLMVSVFLYVIIFGDSEKEETPSAEDSGEDS